jgi:hypothetical protein
LIDDEPLAAVPSGLRERRSVFLASPKERLGRRCERFHVVEPLAALLTEGRASPKDFLGMRCERLIVDQPLAPVLSALRG